MARFLDLRFWMHIPSLDIAVMVAPKCGSQTVLAAIGGAVGVKAYKPGLVKGAAPKVVAMEANQAAKLSCRRVAVVRDPVDRFKSLWRNKCRDRTKGVPNELYHITPEQLLNHVERSIRANHHWYPQAWIESGLADELVPIERFESWWTHSPVVHWNATDGEVECDEDRIRRIFSDDVELYERANGQRG